MAVLTSPAPVTATAPQADPPRRRRRWSRIAFHVAVGTAVALWLLPMLWMAVLALSDNEALQRNSQTLVPLGLTFDNVVGELRTSLIPRWFFNSVVVTGITTAGTVLTSALAGYAFGRLHFRFKKPLFVLTLAGLMVPREAMFIPLYLMFATTDQLNSYQALSMPRIALPLGVFIMTQFFKAVPAEMEEAARLDGAGHWRTFFQIMLPLAKPAMAALAIFAFVQSWNDYLWPLVVGTNPQFYTLTVGLAQQQASFEAARSLGDLMARGVLGSLPLVVVFLLFQRHLVRGIALGSGEK
ncbi:ABC transporter permease [Actinotalea ferrariae CF5-4]|uniref:ABC transporter permease n=1 Tax=Actinotalea ferrariae CF5-4 TaxID=948458 RepID=A0A021VQE9_9CELL|nr:carbohydrate ABC transporter permease [Actinotalea ferrariae]EYR63399.1 ABC transporter permease [Actinotalea ferrariae CF5-4]